MTRRPRYFTRALGAVALLLAVGNGIQKCSADLVADADAATAEYWRLWVVGDVAKCPRP